MRQIPGLTSLPSYLTAKKSMKIKFSSDKRIITIFLRSIQRLQILQYVKSPKSREAL